MTFAEMVKNREWEKIFDILDQGKIGLYERFFLAESCIGSILKDKLGVLTKEEFEESLKQSGFEENDLDTARNGSFLWEFC